MLIYSRGFVSLASQMCCLCLHTETHMCICVFRRATQMYHRLACHFSVTHSDFGLSSLLTQPPECWVYRCVPLLLALVDLLNNA